jgi:hypothetical protein
LNRSNDASESPDALVEPFDQTTSDSLVVVALLLLDSQSNSGDKLLYRLSHANQRLDEITSESDLVHLLLLGDHLVGHVVQLAGERVERIPYLVGIMAVQTVFCISEVCCGHVEFMSEFLGIVEQRTSLVGISIPILDGVRSPVSLPVEIVECTLKSPIVLRSCLGSDLLNVEVVCRNGSEQHTQR